jgi:hypothetical protein
LKSADGFRWRRKLVLFSGYMIGNICTILFHFSLQINWLNDYHEICREKVGELLHEQGKMAAYRWLVKETEPLG